MYYNSAKNLVIAYSKPTEKPYSLYNGAPLIIVFSEINQRMSIINHIKPVGSYF